MKTIFWWSKSVGLGHLCDCPSSSVTEGKQHAGERGLSGINFTWQSLSWGSQGRAPTSKSWETWMHPCCPFACCCSQLAFPVTWFRGQPMQWGCSHSGVLTTMKTMPADIPTGHPDLDKSPLETPFSGSSRLTFQMNQHSNWIPDLDGRGEPGIPQPADILAVKKQNKTGTGAGYKPWVPFSSPKIYFLRQRSSSQKVHSLPRQYRLPGTECLHEGAYGGHFTSKPRHTVFHAMLDLSVVSVLSLLVHLLNGTLYFIMSVYLFFNVFSCCVS